MNQYKKSAAKNKIPDKEIVEIDRRQTSTTPNTEQTSTLKKVNILIVLHYSVSLFKETNQYEKSAAKNKIPDEEIVKVDYEQASITSATGQVYQKNYRDPFVLDISQVLIESCQKSKTSQDLEESHTDKEMTNMHFLKSSFEYTRTIKSRELSLSRMPHRDFLSREFLPYDFSSSLIEPSESLTYRYNNSNYEKLKRGRMCEVYKKLKEIKGKLNELCQDYIKLHSHNKYINHENKVLRAEINNLKSQISSQDDADVKSSESESNDNDNRPGKKRKTEMKQINDWLAALFKYRKAQLLYIERGVIDKDNRKLHKNNRLSKKKSRRVKGAISLFKRNDDRVKDYDKTEVLNILKDTCYHSPKDSETDKEQLDGKRKIIVYDLSWHSDEV
ncbi:hypothetical protein GLOIN_2v1791567 [Rhizophagus irregularis DAOM 181602=DAOM 197198]|uniref:Uncharacterized protein n=1 Tax=Rhizophagus irregularis (strain DAOM 181602 / DAOM 197198 / MUCL 43194) TaxID=747089 RepID=A0A2P4NWV2_RHIID|nr:hypothetical protein GLOIN_2v1791567 [Rhizophagus irregularis DAOM 181602=DAOM 197198]POG57625.1 hypothetical protein GLOIN_2v1791567 [Rhizophagus irregularis DAOM 181602=DAOM 197198]|eukprot:XP_025164491.1 hypothetical protein GLOIN_2v1791567 [Rhizophagus irregularis DAOM 181602=DAOM 197198]